MSASWLIILGAGAATAWAVTQPKWKDNLKGGLADKRKPSDFDQRQLKRGIRVEREHTSNKRIATEVAMDHLTEDKDYYRKLAKMEGNGHSKKRRKKG